jgi:molecular chaperone GrpE
MDDPKAEAAPLPAEGTPEQKAADYYGQLLRLKAEFENYRKRVDRERPQLVKSGSQELLAKLLPIYDVLLKLHRELHAHPKAGSLAHGMELIFKEFEKVYQSEGVTPMEDVVGKPYDPEREEVLGVVETAEAEPDTVVEELQKGFLAGGKVLRTAKVKIAKRPAPIGEGNEGGTQ